MILKLMLLSLTFLMSISCASRDRLEIAFKSYGEGDYDLSIKQFEKLCSSKEQVACFELGKIYSTGLGAEVDKPKAISFYLKGCDLNYSIACEQGAFLNVSNQINSEQNYLDALKLFEKACT